MPDLLSLDHPADSLGTSILMRDDETESPLNDVSTPGNAITAPRVLSGATRLNSLTEGYLLRHFGRALGPWVCSKSDVAKFPLAPVFCPNFAHTAIYS